jgi:hypothetical protein
VQGLNVIVLAQTLASGVNLPAPPRPLKYSALDILFSHLQVQQGCYRTYSNLVILMCPGYHCAGLNHKNDIYNSCNRLILYKLLLVDSLFL